MNRRMLSLLVLVMLVATVLISAGCSSSSTTPTTPMAPTTPKTTPSTTPSGTSGTSVKIVDYAFQPDPLTVSAGTTVTWTNNGAVAHTVTGTGWGSSTLQPGSTYTYTFNTPGVYPYHCSIHPTLMNGTVTVTGAGATGTTTTPTTPTGY